MRYIFGENRRLMQHELFNAASMLPGVVIAMFWPTHGTCSIVPYTYAAVCIASTVYHLANYVLGYRHYGLFIMDVFMQMVCCASITYNGWAGKQLSLFIFGMALGVLGCKRGHAIFLAGTSIMLTSGPHYSSVWWVLAFGLYLSGKATPFKYFHVLFHAVGHMAVHCTVANMSCYGLPCSHTASQKGS